MEGMMIDELLRNAMRRWASGVAVVTSCHDGQMHGMTVNSFSSLSLDPPRVAVTMANGTRSQQMVALSGVFAVTVLSASQQALADRFSGKTMKESDRFAGLDVFTMQTGAPMLTDGLAYLDCRVVQAVAMDHSTLFIGQVLDARRAEELDPLVYFNREYHRVCE
jgi:flavin reductase (DIM6/NTAB) family NADH-FMN oxidoreductase RutF